MAKVHTIELIDGSGKFVRLAKEHFQKIAVATSSGRDYLNVVLGDIHGLQRLFDVIVTRESVRYAKPDPEPYLLAAEKLGMAPAECYVIEDSENGICSGLSAGCSVIGIATSIPTERLISLGVDFVARNYEDIVIFLDI